ncbi:hypothetical protein [Roseateles amylovorans]|uniref:EAL domain-containing protein n=1 Tax=Roseateles amylovorans TaxID=2978473 RepID=A0ABY6AWV2_9BURK|nr:hypothetical protein [Roseateles amylovorans]UXH76249.1 hypothetical protein N4261_14355 [Roseateles amylovorans]
MTFADTLPLASAVPPSRAGDAGARRTGAVNVTLPASTEGARADDGDSVRFVSQAILDDQGRTFAYELWPQGAEAPRAPGSPRDEDIAAALAHALLDAGVAGLAPEAPLFVPMSETLLMSPLADAVTPSVGVIQLMAQVGAETSVLMRIAQLRSRGVRFCVAGLRDLETSRWLFAPYADYLELDLTAIPPNQLAALADRAAEEGMMVIGKGVLSMAGYQRLRELDVTLFQGTFVAAQTRCSVPALPGCEVETLTRVRRLLSSRVSAEAVAVAVSADPALVLRLQVLHWGLGATLGQSAPGTLAALLSSMSEPVLSGWLHILGMSACHEGDRDWRASVRTQVEQYRRALRRRAPHELESALEGAVWAFQSRLCSPRHYRKSRKYLDERLAA